MVQTQCSELKADFRQVASFEMLFCGSMRIYLFSLQSATTVQKAAKVILPLAFSECVFEGHPELLG
jgi:hypothetical protein